MISLLLVLAEIKYSDILLALCTPHFFGVDNTANIVLKALHLYSDEKAATSLLPRTAKYKVY